MYGVRICKDYVSHLTTNLNIPIPNRDSVRQPEPLLYDGDKEMLPRDEIVWNHVGLSPNLPEKNKPQSPRMEDNIRATHRPQQHLGPIHLLMIA